MFIKATITTVIAALLAGGVVYYGLPQDEGGSVQVDVSPEKAEEPEKERWIDKYLKPEDKNEADRQNQLRIEPDDQSEETSEPVKTSEPEVENAVEDVQIEIKESEPQIEEVMPVPVDAPTQSAALSDILDRLIISTRQAEQISDPNLKDEAYMEVVIFTVANGLFSEAEDALQNIQQVEFRDTARSRVANAYAQSGQARAAFELIEQVETEAMRDILRLQAIRALIRPQDLTQGL